MKSPSASLAYLPLPGLYLGPIARLHGDVAEGKMFQAAISIVDFPPVRVLKVCLPAKLRRPELLYNSPGNFLSNMRYTVKPAYEPGPLYPLVYLTPARTIRVRAFSVARLGANCFREADEGTSELALKDYATRSHCLPARSLRGGAHVIAAQVRERGRGCCDYVLLL